MTDTKHPLRHKYQRFIIIHYITKSNMFCYNNKQVMLLMDSVLRLYMYLSNLVDLNYE